MKRFLMVILLALAGMVSANPWGSMTGPEKQKLDAAKMGLPGIGGNWVYVSAKNGNANASGQYIDEAVLTVAQAYSKVATGGGICFLDTTAFEMAKACTSAKANVTYWGIPGVTRIVTASVRGRATSNRTMFLVTGNGNKFYGLNIRNQDSVGIRGIELRSDNNTIEKCIIVGGYTRGAPGGDSLMCASVACSTSSNNTFIGNTFGTDAVLRGEVVGGVVAFGGAQSGHVFKDCNFKLMAAGASIQGALKMGPAATTNGLIYFDNCNFNAVVAAGTVAAVASVVVGTAQTKMGLIMTRCSKTGFTAWDGVDTDLMYVANSAPTDSVGFGVPK